MKKIVIAVVAMLTLAAAAHAEGTMGGLGFHSSGAPVGLRQWFTDQMGVDLGVGFSSDGFEVKAAGAPKFKNASTFVFELGLPFSAKKWERVNFIVRPGLRILTIEDKDQVVSNTTKASAFGITGEFEAEVMLAEKVSVSASHGVGYFQFTDRSAPTKTISKTFTTTGENFTELGFHVYLW